METIAYNAKIEQIKTLTLEKIKFGMNLPLSSEMIQDANIEVISDFLSEQIIASFRTRILGQKNNVIYDINIEVPLNWFEAFKQSILPKWWLNKYPVKTRDITEQIEVKASALFPELGSIENKYQVKYFQSI